MADEIIPAKGNFQDYKPLNLNLGVWWNMSAEGSKTSLTVNMTRDGLIFIFRHLNDANEKIEIFKKLTKAEVFMFVNMYKAFLADRMALAKQHYESGAEGPVQYSVLPELNCQINNLLFSKEKREFDVTSTITLGTVEVNGVQRMAISIHTSDGKHIRVVFYEDRGPKLVKISKWTVIDPEDIQFLLFCFEIERSLGKTVEYAGFDKIYQMLKKILDQNGGNKYHNGGDGQNKGSFFGGFFKKDEARKIEVNDSNDADSDLFGGVDETTF